jgi:hypothetical protein
MLVTLPGCVASSGVGTTGAEEVARQYYGSIVRSNWADAYAVVQPDSTGTPSAARFAEQAKRFRQQLGFEPEQVVVRSCEEQSHSAFAHVVIKGGGRSYKHAIVLRKVGEDWRVVVPARFGEAR